MQQFATAREAKEYLVGKISEGANRSGTPLSETERKMLYFSEANWTLPDIEEVSKRFDRDYSQSAYEEKIGRLARSFRARAEEGDTAELRLWEEATRTLKKEDHYLLVLIDAPRGSAFSVLKFGKLAVLGALFALAILLGAYLLIAR